MTKWKLRGKYGEGEIHFKLMHMNRVNKMKKEKKVDLAERETRS